MSKKPAPLTSDLLVRKGDATPSSIDPQDRATAPEASTPPAEEPVAPVMPEPEIVLAADAEDEETQGSRRRLAAVLALVAVVTAGVLAINMFGDDDTTSVAPLTDGTDVAAVETPSVAPIITPPGPQSEGVPLPPSTPELRLNPAETPVAETTPVEPSVSEADLPTPTPAPEIEEAPAIVVPAPVAPPREAATITPPATVTPPAPVVEVVTPPAAPALARPGQYLVQLLSVRSEAAANAAWTDLQSSHSDLLGGEALNIEAADLGERGTFYRVRFGAFDAKADATAVCKQLKAQGQDCLVKRAN
jgi:SPOR domain